LEKGAAGLDFASQPKMRAVLLLLLPCATASIWGKADTGSCAWTSDSGVAFDVRAAADCAAASAVLTLPLLRQLCPLESLGTAYEFRNQKMGDTEHDRCAPLPAR